IPRLHGFEILMASYAMAHLKLDLLLRETGYQPKDNQQRLHVYLTNSLEEHHPDTGTLWAGWLSREANEANHIKRDTPVMVVLGNPPYSGESENKGEWIMSLMKDYKMEPGGKEKLKERNSKWINDDYVKFMRYAQQFVERNGEGIVAYINPHGFLDNPTFRGMRWNLLQAFDSIYVLDLHGNSNKKEVCRDGSNDENVFDIKQGVSINLLVKTGKKRIDELGRIFHADVYGTREVKYDYLWETDIQTAAYKEIPAIAPNYFFVPKDFRIEQEYKKGINITELFPINGVGLTTAHDDFVIKDDFEKLLHLFEDFQSSERNIEILHQKFNVQKKKGWDILKGYDNIKGDTDLKKYIKPISYRPFDSKYVFYEDKLVWRTVRKVMQHFLKGKNVGLLTTKAFRDDAFRHVFITDAISEVIFLSGTTASNAINFPLYLYPSSDTLFDGQQRTPNLDMHIVGQIAKKLGLEFTPEKVEQAGTFAPIDILDYIYAILHSPGYREKYHEFLKIDFPRVPYPEDQETFWQLVTLGGELRQIHLLESPVVEQFITTYPVDGGNIITRKITTASPGFELVDTEKQTGRVWINNQQYFDQVPLVAWEFYIGGYQPAQKWLKDRHGRQLGFDDIRHYQKIIVALSETDRIMKKIDEVWEV
ncbi:MAG TPA: DNA methyltransferase, partial [bacterium]|nr:DNA methyltransferase [bacterium]